MTITLLGTSCPPPNPRRHGPATLIAEGAARLLVDAGSGVNHTGPDEVGPVAVRADVPALVLTHLMPGSDPADLAARAFSGRIVVGEDLLQVQESVGMTAEASVLSVAAASGRRLCPRHPPGVRRRRGPSRPPPRERKERNVALIDVHNHLLSKAWVDLLSAYGGQRYQIQRDPEGRTIVLRKGARFLGLTDAMFDPEMRLRAMDEVGVQTELLSYTCPNCYWAEGKHAEEVVRVMNDHLADVCARWPQRFRGLGSLPMQDVDLALKELERAVDQLGMIGFIILANVNETPLDDPRFEPIWAALNARRLPVLLHPTVPPGAELMGMNRYGLVPSLGFMFDTTLAVTRLILAGVFERYPDWPLIVGHTGATLPYLAGRLDICWRHIPETRQGGIAKPPSEYLKRLFYDTVTFDEHALHLAYQLAGPRQILYGSDYPHVIGDMKGCADRITALPIPEAEKELIRSGNARRIFRLA